MRNPERHLWICILNRAILDAFGLDVDFSSMPAWSGRVFLARAKEYINENNRDFIEVCENAGFCPHLLAKEVRMIFEGKKKPQWLLYRLRRQHASQMAYLARKKYIKNKKIKNNLISGASLHAA